jgi:rare lipoprotein A
MRLRVNQALPLAALILLSACGGGDRPRAEIAPLPTSGPAADYPVVLGDPFTVEGTTYTPVDKLNYDVVGMASVGGEGGAAISGAHKTMPLPSYVEVTELDTGKTILVRLERRGPMVNDRLIELSPGAAAQLGIEGRDSAPVRVRRVNPPEAERAQLRSGQRAPGRMDTPKPLLTVLMRKLDPGAAPGFTTLPASQPAPVIANPPRPAPQPVARPTAQAAPAHGGMVVQVAAFSARSRAEAAATSLGGVVQQAGSYWRVRIGPFATQREAAAALAKARAAGYSDARIQRAD